MRRLERHQNKQFNTTIVSVLFLFIIFIVFIFTFGLKLLLNTSVFISNITNKPSRISLTKDNNFIGRIEIENIPEATNSATIIITGSVLNFNQLEFNVNGKKVKEINLTSSDRFSEEIGDLEENNNEVYILAKVKNTDKKKLSKKFTVIYKKDKPKLEIKEPQDNLRTNKQEIKISGLTDKEIFVKVNDYPIVVDSRGNFQTTLRLKDGENIIEIIAQDIAGNEEKKTLTVNYSRDE